MCVQRKHHVRAQRCSQPSWEERSYLKSTVLEPWSCTSRLQKYDTMHICHLWCFVDTMADEFLLNRQLAHHLECPLSHCLPLELLATFQNTISFLPNKHQGPLVIFCGRKRLLLIPDICEYRLNLNLLPIITVCNNRNASLLTLDSKETILHLAPPNIISCLHVLREDYPHVEHCPTQVHMVTSWAWPVADNQLKTSSLKSIFRAALDSTNASMNELRKSSQGGWCCGWRR